MPAKKEPSSRPEVKKDTRPYLYAVGKRKTSIAKVRLYKNGKGNVEVNHKKLEEYFFGVLIQKVHAPLKILGAGKTYDMTILVEGGGVAAQADAIAHGISKALATNDEMSRTTLKRAGFLTRDSRVKERKKYGLKKARRSPQWSKR